MLTMFTGYNKTVLEMITIPYHLYGNASLAAGANITSVQAIANGPIVAVQFGSSVDPTVDLDLVAAFELSFLGSALGYGQDSRSVVAKWLLQHRMATAVGSAECFVDGFIANIHVPWAIGERLYLNSGGPVAAACTAYAFAIVHQAVADGDFSRMSGRL